MADKEVAMLQKQIAKLDDKDFDLEAWKILTISILERIFGVNSHKIEQLKQLKYDFSSWALRDNSGTQGSIKKKSRVILEAAINELENFGLPQPPDADFENSKTPKLLEVFENELKGFQFKKLQEILKIAENEQKLVQLEDFCNQLDSDEVKILLIKTLAKL